MLEAWIGQKVVVDLRGRFVCMGTLAAFDAEFVEMRNADFHDLHDTNSTREIYIADSAATGVKRNRKRVLLARPEVVAVSLLADVVEK